MIKNLPKTIAQTQKGLLEKKFSCTHLVDAYLSRILKFDDGLNSFLTVCDDLAYHQARKADRIIAEMGRKAFVQYPLLGVVVSHKDLFLTKGVRTTAASKVLEDYIPPYSATVVERLEKAGSILIGKTNCDAWAHGASGENSDFGPTKNPWNREYVPGGSSSGSAVSVSANFSLIATGTDTGGSIRQPASFCNLVGFKPTYGAVSRYGIIAMASSLDSIGHFTRTVEDSQKVFEVTRGEDNLDMTLKNQTSESKGKTFKRKNGELTIGVPKEYFTEGLNREVEKKILEAIKIFKDQKIKIVDLSLPHTKYAISVYYIIQPAEVSSNLARYDGIRYGNERKTFGDEAKRRIMLGTYVLSAGYYDAYYLKAMKVRSRIIADFNTAFEKVDAILAPVSPTPPFKIGEKADNPLEMYLADIFSVSANLAGIPGITLPAGFTDKGLPIGFQLLGQRFSETTLFELGGLFQTQTDYHLKEPVLE